MTIEYRIAGVLLTNRVRLLDEGEGFTTAAERGSVGMGGVLIDDPDSDLTINGWQTFTVDDTEAYPYSRVFTGYIIERQIARRGGVRRASVERVHDCTVMDVNGDLHLRVLRTNAAKRPAETDVARVQWLLTSEALSGVVVDHGLVSSSNPGAFLESDTRRRYADDVLGELAPSAVKNFFVYRDNATGDHSLFYDRDTSSAYASTSKISNVAADVNGTTVFAPSVDATLERQPSELYSGVSYGWTGEPIYVTSAANLATLGLSRDAVYDNPRAGVLATAQANAEAWLNARSGETDIITVSIIVPSGQVNDIYAGQRLQVKFSHLPGYTSYTWTRVRRRSVKPASPQFWEMRLELWVQPTPASDATVPDDETCIPEATFAELQFTNNGGVPDGPTDYEIVFLHNGDTPEAGWAYVPKFGLVEYEPTYTSPTRFRGLTMLGDGNIDVDLNFGATWIADGVQTMRLSVLVNGIEELFTTAGGSSGGLRFISYTGLITGTIPVVAGDVVSVYFTESNDAISTITFTHNEDENFNISGDLCVLVPDAEDPLPFQGDWVGPTTASGTVNASNTLYNNSNSSYPGGWLPNTLRVLHDGIDQTAHVASSDADVGSFTLDYAPSFGSTMRVTYQSK